MYVSFISRVQRQGKIEEHEIGRAVLMDGKVRFLPKELGEMVLRNKGNAVIRLDPSEGKKYLEALPKVYHNAYLYATLLEGDGTDWSPGGANPGGAERK